MPISHNRNAPPTGPMPGNRTHPITSRVGVTVTSQSVRAMAASTAPPAPNDGLRGDCPKAARQHGVHGPRESGSNRTGIAKDSIDAEICATCEQQQAAAEADGDFENMVPGQMQAEYR